MRIREGAEPREQRAGSTESTTRPENRTPWTLASPYHHAPVSFDYELLVIGSGPAGQKAAIQAAKLGRKVAVVEREQVRGVSVIGQAVMGFEGTVDYLVDAVFNYPTLAESYKVAALDARNKLLAVERLAR